MRERKRISERRRKLDSEIKGETLVVTLREKDFTREKDKETLWQWDFESKRDLEKASKRERESLIVRDYGEWEIYIYRERDTDRDWEILRVWETERL